MLDMKFPEFALSRRFDSGATASRNRVCAFASILSLSFVSLEIFPFKTLSSLGHLVWSTLGAGNGFLRLCLSRLGTGFPNADLSREAVFSDTSTKAAGGSVSSQYPLYR